MKSTMSSVNIYFTFYVNIKFYSNFLKHTSIGVVFVQASNVTWYRHDSFMIHSWYSHDKFYDAFQIQVVTNIFLQIPRQVFWLSTNMAHGISLNILHFLYISDAFMIHNWYIHDAFIRSLNENDYSIWFDSSTIQICCVKTNILTFTKNEALPVAF